MAKFKRRQVPWNKDRKSPWSKETIEKMNEGRRRYWNNPLNRVKQSQATKKGMDNPKVLKKISESSKGRTSWMKGKQHTSDSLKKMSIAVKSAWENKEYRKHMSKVHKGQRNSPKTEFKKGQVPWNKGVPMKEESKKKLSEKHKGKRHSIKTEFKKGYKHTPERIQQIRETTIRLMKSGKFPKQVDTKIEIAIKEELSKRGYKEGTDFIHQFKFMNKFLCDFCFPKK